MVIIKTKYAVKLLKITNKLNSCIQKNHPQDRIGTNCSEGGHSDEFTTVLQCDTCCITAYTTFAIFMEAKACLVERVYI